MQHWPAMWMMQAGVATSSALHCQVAQLMPCPCIFFISKNQKGLKRTCFCPTFAEDIVPGLLATAARTSPANQPDIAAAEAPTPAERSSSGSHLMRRQWLPLPILTASQWINPQRHHQALSGDSGASPSGGALAPRGRDSASEAGQINSLPREEPAGSSDKDHTHHSHAGTGGWLSALQDAASFVRHRMQQLVPSFRMCPALAHFGSHTYLPAVQELDATAAAAQAARASATPEQRYRDLPHVHDKWVSDSVKDVVVFCRRVLLLAMHRMPAYRQRVLALVQRLSSQLLPPMPAEAQPPETGSKSAVALVANLAPELGPLRASARVPLLPPPTPVSTLQISSGTGTLLPLSSLSSQQLRSEEGGGSRWAWPQEWSGPAHRQLVGMHVTLSGPGLASVTSLRAQTDDGTLCRSSVLERPPPPSLSPADATDLAGSIVLHNPKERWWQRWSLQNVWPTKHTVGGPRDAAAGAPPSESLQLQVELPLVQARALQANRSQLQLYMRSDFAAAGLTVRLEPYTAWLVGSTEQAFTTMQHVKDTLTASNEQGAVAHSITSPDVNAADAHVHGEAEDAPLSTAARVARTAANSAGRAKQMWVGWSNRGHGTKGLVPSLYAASIQYMVSTSDRTIGVAAACSLMDAALRSRSSTGAQVFQWLLASAAIVQLTLQQRMWAGAPWRQLQAQPLPDVIVVLLTAADFAAGASAHWHSLADRVGSAVRSLCDAAQTLHVHVVLVSFGLDNTIAGFMAETSGTSK